MLGVGGFPPPPPQHRNTIPQHPILQSLLPFNKTHQTHLSFLSNRVTQFSFCTEIGQIRTGSCSFALNSPGKGGNSKTLLEIENLDDDDDYEEGDEDDNEEEDEDEELVVPLRNMKKWLEKKPRGFGEGKMYDTSIEDELFEEMEQSRVAQLANINKLKNNPEETNSKKELLQKQKVSETIQSGIRVRLVNLPKKKNIHRDLQRAFKGVPGIVNIIPAVTGNKKTREPICTGIAFIDFKSEDEANRFVQVFSGQSITFGKIQKKIECEIKKSSSRNPAHEQSAERTDYAHQLAVPSLEKDLVVKSDLDNPSLDSFKEIVTDEYEGADDKQVTPVWEDTEENLETFSSSEPSGGDGKEQIKETATESTSLKQQKKIRTSGKKLMPKRKVEKVPKLSVPGSANRLKIKEKALLTGAFSKYGVKAPVAVKEPS